MQIAILMHLSHLLYFRQFDVNKNSHATEPNANIMLMRLYLNWKQNMRKCIGNNHWNSVKDYWTKFELGIHMEKCLKGKKKNKREWMRNEQYNFTIIYILLCCAAIVKNAYTYFHKIPSNRSKWMKYECDEIVFVLLRFRILKTRRKSIDFFSKWLWNLALKMMLNDLKILKLKSNKSGKVIIYIYKKKLKYLLLNSF